MLHMFSASVLLAFVALHVGRWFLLQFKMVNQPSLMLLYARNPFNIYAEPKSFMDW